MASKRMAQEKKKSEKNGQRCFTFSVTDLILDITSFFGEKMEYIREELS